MDRKIKNHMQLLDHGDIESRRVVLSLAEATLNELDAYRRIKSIMSLHGNILHV